MAKRSKLIPKPLPLEKMDKNKVSAIVKGLQEGIAFAKKGGEVPMESKTFEEVWTPYYETQDFVSPVENRRNAHIARLAMLYALLDKSRVIRAPHLHAAIAVWTYCRDSARYLFAAHHRTETEEEKILKLLAQHPEGLTTTQITFMAFNNNKAAEPFLTQLEEAGKVRQSKVQTVGRPSVKWFLVTSPLEPNGSGGLDLKDDLMQIEPAAQGHEAQLRAVGGSVLYVPRGEALEYAPLATSAYSGCGLLCVYCYNKTSPIRVREYPLAKPAETFQAA
jgi:hypothetical protein